MNASIRSSRLPLIGVSLLALLFTGCGLLALPYTCPGGTPKSGDAPDRDNRQYCVECTNPHYTVLNKQCVATHFTCTGGNPYEGGGVASASLTRERCTDCYTGYTLNEDNLLCDPELVFKSQEILDENIGTDSVTAQVTASQDADLWWAVYDEDIDITDADTVIADVQSGGGVQNSGTTATKITTDDPHRITISKLSPDTNYVLYIAIDNEDATEAVLSEKLLFTTKDAVPPAFSLQPATTTTTTPTSATVSLSGQRATTLYWVLYDGEPATALTADTLIADATANGGVQRGTNNTTITNGSATVNLSQLSPKQSYYFYAVLTDDFDNKILSDPLTINTSGYLFVCEHGDPASGTTAMQDHNYCSKCDDTYRLDDDDTDDDNNSCVPIKYICQNGDPPATGAPTTGNADVTFCIQCDPGFAFENGMVGDSCVVDTDGDNIQDVSDIDDDNDGLIEISTLQQLHNMRYNLTGSSYKTSATDSGTTTGVPTTEPTTCDDGDSATTITLCGYELVANLSFDSGTNGTWSESGGTYTLDSSDDNNDYFDVDSGGWEPIGDATNRFSAVFDGNNHTITGLAIQRADYDGIGLFGYINNATVKNLTITDSLAIYTGSTNGIGIGIVVGHMDGGTVDKVHVTGTTHLVGSSSADYMGGLLGDASSTAIADSSSSATLFSRANTDNVGGLVGYQRGSTTITASYASGAVDSGADPDYVGGLVGYQRDSTTITASYASGGVGGGADTDSDAVGGLVGYQASSSAITASYATGDVDCGGDVDFCGGLVGEQAGSSAITASYATGDVYGGTGNDWLGGLVGYRPGGTLTASYATGAVDGGAGNSDFVGSLVGLQVGNTSTASYGFGTKSNNENNGIDAVATDSDGDGDIDADDIPADETGLTGSHFTGTVASNAWSFTTNQKPKLLYADYDGTGSTYSCTNTTLTVSDTAITLICGTSILPGQ